MSEPSDDRPSSPVWRRGMYYAARMDGCEDGFTIWQKVGDGEVPVLLGKDLSDLRRLLDDLEQAGPDEEWRSTSMHGSRTGEQERREQTSEPTSVGTWVSAGDALPDLNEFVLVYPRRGIGVRAETWGEDGEPDGGWRWETDGEGFAIGLVTHWASILDPGTGARK